MESIPINSYFLKEFQNWMQICYKAKITETGNFTDKIAKAGRENQKAFLHESLGIIRECLLINRHNNNQKTTHFSNNHWNI